MKKYILLMLIPLLVLSSCMKDTSAYLPQEKQKVVVDPTEPGGSEGEKDPLELTPGINLVKIDVVNNGVTAERRFKYFMPISIDKSKPISLIFDFHGSYGPGADPIEQISLGHPLNQLAIKENCIIVFPAGEDTGSAVNWQNSDIHFPFVDSMVTYFHNHKPAPDPNRIYTCGHSSGAIFSYVLAFYRADIFAAATPVAGQMKIGDNEQVPSTAIPIRAFNGVADDIVIHSAVLSNIGEWANRVAGYFPSDAMESDTLSIDNYKKYLTKKWSGGKADIELYSIIEEGHSINWSYIMPFMWEFMKSHPKGAVSTGFYLSSQIKEIDAMCGQSFDIEIRFSEGANIEIETAPQDWTPSISGSHLKLKAPMDYFASTTLNRKGNIVIKGTLNGSIKRVTIPYYLNAPKSYYEVGDIEYDSNFNPIGVVFWVNPSNIKEAKIISMEKISHKFGAVGYDFFTLDADNGYQNTIDLVQRVNSQSLPLNSGNSAFMYAYEYLSAPGTTSGWYLPAFNELKEVDNDLTRVNEAIQTAGGTPLETASSLSSYYMSSTMVNTGTSTSPVKKFRTYDYNISPNFHGEYLVSSKADNSGYVSVRAVKRVVKSNQ